MSDLVPSTLGDAQTDDALVTLDQLPAGQCGLICQISVGGSELERLKVMGVCLGRRVHVVRRGDPMIVRVMGTRIGLARGVAANIRVTPSERMTCCQMDT